MTQQRNGAQRMLCHQHCLGAARSTHTFIALPIWVPLGRSTCLQDFKECTARTLPPHVLAISLEACMRTYPTYGQAHSLMSCWAERPRTPYSGKELAVRMQLATFQSQICFCSMSQAVDCEICKIRHLHSWQLRTVGSSWPRLQQFCMHLCCSLQGVCDIMSLLS